MADEYLEGRENVDEHAELTERDDRKTWLPILVALAVLVLLLLAWYLTSVSAVPDVTGQSQADASRRLRDAGFELGSVRERIAEAPPGEVVEQEPVGGTRAAQGSAVDIVVAMPVPGETARRDDEDLGGDLLPEFVPGDEEDGMVRDTRPGIAPSSERPIISVLGEREADGRAILKNAGYGVSVRYGPSTTRVPAGRIYYQDPTQGPAGSLVTIWVSTGPPTTGYPYPQPD